MSEFKEALAAVENGAFHIDMTPVTDRKKVMATIRRALQIADKVVVLPRDAEPQVGDLVRFNVTPHSLFETGVHYGLYAKTGVWTDAVIHEIIQRDNKPVIYLEELSDA